MNFAEASWSQNLTFPDILNHLAGNVSPEAPLETYTSLQAFLQDADPTTASHMEAWHYLPSRRGVQLGVPRGEPWLSVTVSPLSALGEENPSFCVHLLVTVLQGLNSQGPVPWLLRKADSFITPATAGYIRAVPWLWIQSQFRQPK